MEQILAAAMQTLAEHGYLVVFLWMFADQVALPIPALPLLIAAGAVAGTGALDPVLVISVAVAGCLLADSIWFYIGRRGGAHAIRLICKLSLEPDSCVTATRHAFGRYGPSTLVFAKYLPGVQTLAPASAGLAGAPWWGFLLLDTIGSLLFVAPFVLGAYLFEPQILALVDWLSAVSGGIVAAVLGVVLVYALFKAGQWIVFLRGHRLRRITPQQLVERMQRSEPVTVVDLRQRMDFELQPAMIPGALRIPLSEVAARRDEIPTRYDVVLVCT